MHQSSTVESDGEPKWATTPCKALEETSHIDTLNFREERTTEKKVSIGVREETEQICNPGAIGLVILSIDLPAVSP